MSDKAEVPDKSKTSDKLEKFLAGRNIILNCLIPGERVNDIFKVTISNANNNQVSSLVEAIRNRRLDQFQDIDSTSLALYKVEFIADSVIINTLRNNNVFIVDGSLCHRCGHHGCNPDACGSSRSTKCPFSQTHINAMSSQASSPALPTSITEEISTRIMSDVVKHFNTEELIEYLKKKNLKLEESHFKILCKEEISGLAFLDTTKEDFQSYGLKAGLATTLAKFIEGLSQKLQNYSSLKTLDDLKEMLRRNKINEEDITNIKQFTPVFEEISDNDKAFKYCMEDIILKLSNMKTMTDANEVMRCEFISAIFKDVSRN
ncbi:hypothetical protein C1646_754805 [Rhizophagus diaphanus]|nr:hypothetical protein C1646_754805 [Rhizophagus diaphanus] [Rhizophagus sp. MUCL 43196]